MALEDIDLDFTENIDNLGEDVSIDTEGLGAEAEKDANDMVKNLSAFYYDDVFMNAHPNLRKRIDVELENLRILLKMRKTDEAAHDALVNAISANNSNASLYRSMAELQKTTLAITAKIQEILTSLNNMIKGYQMELDFKQQNDQQKQTEESSEEQNDKNMFRGSKEFIESMQKQLNSTEEIPVEVTTDEQK